MFNKSQMILATVLGLLLSSSVTLAASDSLSTSSESVSPIKLNGWYIGGGLTQSFIDESKVSSYDGFGINLNVGYKWQVAPLWAAGVEVEFFSLGQIDDDYAFGATAINAVGEYQFNDKISMSAKLGSVIEDISYENIDGSSDSAPLLGAAIQYHFNSHWSGSINCDHIFGDGDFNTNSAVAVSLIGIGTQYVF